MVVQTHFSLEQTRVLVELVQGVVCCMVGAFGPKDNRVAVLVRRQSVNTSPLAPLTLQHRQLLPSGTTERIRSSLRAGQAGSQGEIRCEHRCNDWSSPWTVPCPAGAGRTARPPLPSTSYAHLFSCERPSINPPINSAFPVGVVVSTASFRDTNMLAPSKRCQGPWNAFSAGRPTPG